MTEKLDTSTPPKVRIIKEHLITYIEMTGNTLNHVSDQHVEASHAKVAKQSKMSNYERKISNRFSAWQAMKKKVRHVNSHNVENFKKLRKKLKKFRSGKENV